jgi:hypothetical protein
MFHPVVTGMVLPPPTAVAANAGNGFADVHWQPPTTTPRGPVLAYMVQTSLNGATVSLQYVAADVRQISVPSLTNGSTYAISVAAVDAVGSGVPSNPVSVTPSAAGTAAVVPAAPTAVSAGTVKVGDGFVTASWAPPATDGGSPITAYSVIAIDSGGAVRGWQNVGTDVRSASIDGLTNGTAYTVEVVAWNAKGIGAPLAAPGKPAAGTPSTGPLAPLWVVASQSGPGTAAVSWGPPPGDGGAPIRGYSVIAMQGSTVVGWLNLASSARSATVTKLPAGSNITIYVVATNAKGFGTTPPPTTVHIT